MGNKSSIGGDDEMKFEPTKDEPKRSINLVLWIVELKEGLEMDKDRKEEIDSNI